MIRWLRQHLTVLFLALFVGASCTVAPADPNLRSEATQTIKEAATCFRSNAATHGRYVYYYNPDFEKRLGEGVATDQQVRVEPPGTPTAAMSLPDNTGPPTIWMRPQTLPRPRYTDSSSPAGGPML